MDPVYVREGDTLWQVYPFKFEVPGAEPVLNEENEGFKWVSRDEVSSMDTVKDTVTVVDFMLR